uniref:Uncharacterized protein n=1 Tax=Magallana gigas TaxID=29159 RepID=A0A8W8IV69_MAGGI
MSINLVNCVGNCTKSDGKTGCCNNYHRSNGICVKCPKGTYGENCSEICPVNLYGELCLKRCDCKPNEDCNRVHGCLPSIIIKEFAGLMGKRNVVEIIIT